MENSNIEWTDHTFNPWIGCVKVSPGCQNCYAMNQDSWRKWNGQTHWGPTTPRKKQSDGYWRKPRQWNQKAKIAETRHRVFCASMADVFEDHPDVITERRRLWDLIRQTPNLDWLILTKRPENFGRFLPEDWGAGWSNVWLMVSVEDQKWANKRIPVLQATPAAVRGLSVEPLIAPVDLAGLLDGIHWVIIGGESDQRSGPARPMFLDWARKVKAQCEAANIPVFVKQLGSVWAKETGSRHKKGGDWSDWPPDLRVRDFPGTSVELPEQLALFV